MMAGRSKGRTLFVGSTAAGAGRTVACWAVADSLTEDGRSVGFIKLRAEPTVEEDPDLNIMVDLCGEDGIGAVDEEKLPDPERAGDRKKQMLAKAASLVDELAKKRDAVIVMGSSEIFFDPAFLGVTDTEFIRDRDLPLVLLDRFRGESQSIYSALAVDSYLEGRTKALVINRVPEQKLEAVRRRVASFVESKGIPQVVILPEDGMLASLTIRDVTELLNANVIAPGDSPGLVVESFTINPSALEGSLNIFKRLFSKIILMGRSMAEPDERRIVGLVITGGKRLGDAVVDVAGRSGIPVIYTEDDTFVAMEKLESAAPALKAEDTFKMKRFKELMMSQLDLSRLF